MESVMGEKKKIVSREEKAGGKESKTCECAVM